MKKTRKCACFLMAIFLAFALVGCYSYQEPDGVGVYSSSDGVSYSINYNKKSIEYNGVEYTYAVDGSRENPTITITYPNGATYFSDGDISSWSDNYDETLFTPGQELVKRIRPSYTAVRRAPGAWNFIVTAICIVTGLFQAIFPRKAWELGHLFTAWKYKSIEPSDDGLTMGRVSGIILIIIGVLLFFERWS